MKKIWDNINKAYYLWLVVDIVFMLYCLLFIEELKWKLLLLPQGGLLFIRIVFLLLEDNGLNKPASMLRKIHKVLSVLFIAVCIIVLLGCFLGVWNL